MIKQQNKVLPMQKNINFRECNLLKEKKEYFLLKAVWHKQEEKNVPTKLFGNGFILLVQAVRTDF